MRPLWRDPFLLGHAVVVAFWIVVFVLLSATYDGQDANIGAGMAGLVVALLGAPWSLMLLATNHTLGPAAQDMALLGSTAILNVVLHAVLRGLISRRDTTNGP